ncbi:hypothetical protein EJ06DRAFT_535619 [Trichodelitschia bisporula]|uniref:SH3 domain-containing protein n=1 Tax=Trichodelitschia bisporula TaxID=703511 RepID=A0A6G1I8K4_9PEZI|nr:hypothetical protein EJ06DRAFT_535619 [Trichodelitschia bisporula]
MAAVLSPQMASQTSPTVASPLTAASPNPNLAALPPLVTSPALRSQSLQRTVYSKHRLSTFSMMSNASGARGNSRSRPQSMAFPHFHSSLPYTLVRDFAYQPSHPCHYGPPPEQSGVSTPQSEVHRRLSDPVPNWDSRGWSATSWSAGEHLPTTSFGDHDGPPWSEDDDLQSPVVTSARHRKNKSNVVGFDQRGRPRDRRDNPRRGAYTGTNGDGSQTYYISELDESVNSPGGEFITYPPATDSSLSAPSNANRRDSHFATTLPNRSYTGVTFEEETSSPGSAQDDDDDDAFEVDESRYSRDYQFTIASPDEEMHGRAVALFDFARENENELPLSEGQVILVSYRHGQGWLVAQDPKTGESGLVPEEYVRLLRDIEGGWQSIVNGETGVGSLDAGTGEARTPTQADYYAPVVSTFSTTREDLEKWPHHLRGGQVLTPVKEEDRPRTAVPDAKKDEKKADAVAVKETGSQAVTPTGVVSEKPIS